MDGRDTQRGQAAVELTALLPVLAVAAFVVWQLCRVAHDVVLLRSAGRADDRAREVGLPAGAARAVLPARIARRTTAGDGGVAATLAPRVRPDGPAVTVRVRWTP